MAEQSLTHTSNAPKDIKNYLKDINVRKRADELLGKRAPQLIASLTAMVNADNTLAKCEPNSLFMAAVTAAALDLPVNKNLAFAHIVPYGNTKAGVTEAQFQLGWRGYVQLAQRSGQYKTISSAPVYDGQLVAEDPLLGNTYDWTQKDSDTIIGYVAMFKLMNGFEKDFYMSVDEIRRHADRYSKAYNHGKGFGPWKDNFDAMALKTVIKLLISRWGPMSVEMQKAVEVDSAVIKETGEPEYIDGEISDVGANDDKKSAIIAANSEPEDQPADSPPPKDSSDPTGVAEKEVEPEPAKPRVNVKERAASWAEERKAENHAGEQGKLINEEPKGDKPARRSTRH